MWIGHQNNLILITKPNSPDTEDVLTSLHTNFSSLVFEFTFLNLIFHEMRYEIKTTKIFQKLILSIFIIYPWNPYQLT